MELCDKYLYDLISINPTMNDFFSLKEFIHKRHIQPNVYSERYYEKLYQLDKKYLRLLNQKKEKTFYDEILLRDIKNNIHMELEYEIYMYIPVNLNDNILIDYVTECNGSGLYQFIKRKDYTIFLQRLKVLSQITNEIILKMKHGIKNKVCLPRRTVDKMIENIQDILKHKLYQHRFKKGFKPSHWDETVEKYLVKNLQKFLSFLINDYYTHTIEGIGLSSYKGGKDAYRKVIQYETFDTITPQEVHDLGWRELKRLQKEKKKLQKNLGLKNIDETVQKYNYTNKEGILNDLRKIRDKLQNKIFPKYFHGKINNKDVYQIKEIRGEDKHYFAYYIPPNLTNTTKGKFYINTLKPESINQHELYVLSLHEGIPGHHYEITFHNNNNNIPNYLKLGNTAYSEGWGLYSENLGDYKENYEYYFKIQYEIHRSLRLIIDTGIHFFGWSYEKCFKLMKKYLTNHSEKQIENEIVRYMNHPGQAVTYKLGEKAFLYVRDRLLKKGYSIKDIHQKMLEVGPCPIEFLVNVIDL